MNLISDTTRYQFTGAMYNHWTTFSKPIVVYKESLKAINDSAFFPGYGLTNANYDATDDVYRVFSGIKVGPENGTPVIATEIHTSFANKQTYIKVEKDCADYIKIGKTIKVVIDRKNYYIENVPQIKDYLGLKFYLFTITETD